MTQNWVTEREGVGKGDGEKEGKGNERGILRFVVHSDGKFMQK